MINEKDTVRLFQTPGEKLEQAPEKFGDWIGSRVDALIWAIYNQRDFINSIGTRESGVPLADLHRVSQTRCWIDELSIHMKTVEAYAQSQLVEDQEDDED